MSPSSPSSVHSTVSQADSVITCPRHSTSHIQQFRQENGTYSKPFAVFPEGDPENPKNWSARKKWTVLIPLCLLYLSLNMAATAYAPTSKPTQKDFGVSEELAQLPLSLFLLGIAIGPLLFAPLSEYLGRSPVYFGGVGLYLCFALGICFVPTSNFGALLALRFLTGLFSSMPSANIGGTIGDMFAQPDIGLPMSFYNWVSLVAPNLGYTIFSFVALRGWRQVYWALLGFAAALSVINVFTLKETSTSALLRHRAKKFRKQTGDGSIDVQDEDKQPEPREALKKTLITPFKLLATEPVVMFGAAYYTFLYSLNFGFTGAYDLIFGKKGHGFTETEVGLAFLGITIGVTIGVITNIYQENVYRSALYENKGKNTPESRIGIARWAGIALPASLFWFAWTTFASVHWIVPITSSVLFGWAYFVLIQATTTYVVSTYMEYSASALASTAVCRNIAGAGIPLFILQMYRTLGYQWASSFFGFVAVLMVPIMFVLYTYGKKLRKQSPWAKEHVEDIILDTAENDDDESR